MNYDYFWDRRTGYVTDKKTGNFMLASNQYTIREWYTLLATFLIEIIQQNFKEEAPIIIGNKEINMMLQVTPLFNRCRQVYFDNISYEYGLPIGTIIQHYYVYEHDMEELVFLIKSSKIRKTVKITGFSI